MPLSIVELKRLCIELGIIKADDRNADAEPVIHCTINKLYELILRIT
jgi:hypothetical protein